MVESKESREKLSNHQNLAVILVRGFLHMEGSIRSTLQMLNLHHRLCCVVVKDTPAYKGMLRKCKDYITWGEINEATLKELKDKRQETIIVKGEKIVAPFFRLHPPVKGFERGGIKASFKTGGVVGYRSAKVNDLLKRMI